MSRASVSSLTTARMNTPQGIRQSSEMVLRRIVANPRVITGPAIQLARTEVRNGRILVSPERSDFPTFTLPNNAGAAGFSPGFFSHDYLVVNLAPVVLSSAAGLTLVGKALAADPTPGRDGAPSGIGTRNDVGPLVPWDGGDNLVNTYAIPSSDRRRSLTIINYTIKGQHSMNEGFVLRFGHLRADGRVELITYGEGNAALQSNSTGVLWRSRVTRVWTENASEIFAAALRGRR